MSRACQLGNKRGVKLKNEDTRQKAYAELCNHVASGMPIEAFHYNDGSHSACYKTVLRYVDENPAEFPSILMSEAKAARYKKWLLEGTSLMKGEYKNGSPVVWQTIMRNMFKDIGWDREQINENNKTHVQRIAESIRGTSAFSEAEISDSEEQQAD